MCHELKSKEGEQAANVIGIILLLHGHNIHSIAVFQRVLEKLKRIAPEGPVALSAASVPVYLSRYRVRCRFCAVVVCVACCYLRSWLTLLVLRLGSNIALGIRTSVLANLAHGLLLARRWSEAADAYSSIIKSIRTLSMDLGVWFQFGHSLRVDAYRCLSRSCLELNNLIGSKRSTAAAVHCFPAHCDVWCDVAAILFEVSTRHVNQRNDLVVSTGAALSSSREMHRSSQAEYLAALSLCTWLLMRSDESDDKTSEHSKQRILQILQRL